MFGSKPKDSQTEAKKEPTFDPRTIPVHTMRDDLDMLEGKPVPAAQTVSENSPFQNDPLVKKEVPKVPAPVSGAPSPLVRNTAAPKAGFPSDAGAFGYEAKAVSDDTASKKAVPAETHNWTRIAGIFILCAAGLGLLGGGYYFYMTRYNVPAVELQVPDPAQEQIETVPEPAVVQEKFSSDKPNYLMLEVEKMGVLEIQKVILEKAGEIQKEQKTVPVEFVVVDANNNPIAFKIFAVLAKIDLSQKMLDNLEDDFSLFIFSDQGNVRVGLVLDPKNSGKIAADMKAEEKTLARTLDPLFLGEKAKSLVGSFKDSREGDTVIRYVNLNDQNSLSIDYWVRSEKLFVATSKNTGRAILKKMAELKQ